MVNLSGEPTPSARFVLNVILDPKAGAEASKEGAVNAVAKTK